MRFISTKMHGYLDYTVGILLIISPWVLGFFHNDWESWIPILLGAAAIIYSLLTDYELGVSRTISMRTHLVLDFLSGALLASSPWLFDFSGYVWKPHLVLGILEMCAAIFTIPVRERRQ
jgi:hypothetical protein